MVTIKEVAQHAKVSPATVSRVINGAGNVDPDIRARVRNAIKELGYFPNRAARSLVCRQMGAIAVLLRNLHSPFFTKLLEGFEEGALHCEHTVVFSSLGREAKYRDRYIQFLTNGFSDAFILYGPYFSDRSIIEHLLEVNFPFLLIENSFDDLPVHQLMINNTEGASNAVEYLIQRGHKHIAHFMGDPNKKVILDRMNGYMLSLRKFGLPMNPGDLVNIQNENDMAFNKAQELMRLPREQRPTAIFASSDRIAVKAIQGIQSMGFSVPRDISVIGFDNQTVFSDDYNGPLVTSVRQPLFEIGRDSIGIVEEIMKGQHSSPIIKTYDTQLIERETVAPPPQL